MAGRASSSAPKVAVLMGGPSAEREVSLSSGHECAVALRQAGYEVTEIDAGRDLPAQLAAAAPDMVFNALHGRRGEDGCVQGLMDWLGFRYTHSGVLASALAMDKTRAKHAFREAGLPVMKSLIADAAEVRQRHVMPPPPDTPMSADRVRWEHIQRVYEQCERNVSETARRLHMHRRTLQRILAKRSPR